MSRKDMLGGLVERLVRVSDEMLGMLDDLLTKTLNPEWFSEFKKFLRREPCWVAVTKTAEEVKVYLRRLFIFTLEAIKREDLPDPKKVFRAYLDPDFANWGISFSGSALKAEITTDELIRDGRLTDFLGSTAEELEKRRIKGSQFLSLCWRHSDQLRGEGYANFFVLTKSDEVVAEDLSNVFVADVSVNDRGKLDANLSLVSDDSRWGGDYGHRFFSLKLQLGS